MPPRVSGPGGQPLREDHDELPPEDQDAGQSVTPTTVEDRGAGPATISGGAGPVSSIAVPSWDVRHVFFRNKSFSQYPMSFYVSQSPDRVNDLSEVYIKAYDVNASPIDVIRFKNYLTGYPSKLFLEVLDMVKNGANLHTSLQF